MAGDHGRSVPIPSSSPFGSPQRSVDASANRVESNARLTSPIPSFRRASPHRLPDESIQRRESSSHEPTSPAPLAGSTGRSIGPGQSALASALGRVERSASQSQNRPQQPSAAPSGQLDGTATPRSNYGSFAAGSLAMRERYSSPVPRENMDVVRRHLARTERGSRDINETALDERFDSLRTEGGDITREIVRRAEADETSRRGSMQRSQSMAVLRPPPQDNELDIENMHKIGGMRRNYLARQTPAGPSSASQSHSLQRNTAHDGQNEAQFNFLTRNFYEFLSVYGHFAGEPLEDDSDQTPSEVTDDQDQRDQDSPDEQRPLLQRTLSKPYRREDSNPKKGVFGTVLILLKSFVGTGVMFLPRAFLNGGMVFSVCLLVGVACISYYCFLLLTRSRLVLKASFAKMGQLTNGRTMQGLINGSLVISQVGFASAYIVFTSENLQDFVLAVSHCKTYIDIRLMILMQLILFLPLSLYRNLNNIAFIVYVADVFILLGIAYLYFYGIGTIVVQRGISDIVLFNPESWTLLIGTAIFTFEGIGLIIPIQDGMKRPSQLPSVLGGVMVLITIVFISMGVISYAAYGSKTETVIIRNMDQSKKLVNGLQFIYSLAILLSTPLQIFPAITILEKGIFKRSGKSSKSVKWSKNLFRFFVVIIVALIALFGANDLDKFVSLVGSFACIPLVYIYPVSCLVANAAIADWCSLSFIAKHSRTRETGSSISISSCASSVWCSWHIPAL